MNKENQKTKILNHLQTIGPLCQPEAATRYRIGRLAARIGELRADGYRIKTTMRRVRSGSRLAFYSMEV